MGDFVMQWGRKLYAASSQLAADERGQDLIEYALLCGFMVIAVYVILPADLMPAVSGIFSRVLHYLTLLGGA